MRSFFTTPLLALIVGLTMTACQTDPPKPPPPLVAEGYDLWPNPTIWTVCQSGEVSVRPLTEQSSVEGKTFEYDFGDNTGLLETSNANVSHVYTKPGSYAAKVKVSKGSTLVNTLNLQLEVKPDAECSASGAGVGTNSVFTYIVTLDQTQAAAQTTTAEGLAGSVGARVVYEYKHALKGYAFEMNNATASKLGTNAVVDTMTIGGDFSTQTLQTPTGSWGIDRVDQKDLPLSGGYTYSKIGKNVHAYIVDTGILGSHSEFAGRIGNGYDAYSEGKEAQDCNGHGTHVAGTVGGITYGVAKAVTLHPVRVLRCDGSGTWAAVLAGLDWVVGNAQKPAVVNMSLGSASTQPAFELALKNTVQQGINVVVSAGNSSADACQFSPAQYGKSTAVITVGATDDADKKAAYSNTGACVDIFAPGSNIKSAWKDSAASTSTLSGTSMAAPHVAGVVALLLEATPSATPAQIQSSLVASATTGKVTGLPADTTNTLLFAGGTGDNTCNGGVQVSLAPGDKINLKPGEKQTFNAVVTCATNTKVRWVFSSGGSDASDNTLVYTAPSQAGTHTLTAVSLQDDTKRASTQIVVGATTTPGVAVTIAPATAIMQPGQRECFNAVVTGSTNTKVKWEYGGGSGQSGSNQVCWTAPSTAGTYHIKATALADETKSFTSIVTVRTDAAIGVVVSITPTQITLKRGERQNFIATVRGTTNTDVILELTPKLRRTQSITVLPLKAQSLRVQPSSADTTGQGTELDFQMPSNSVEDYEIKAISVADNTKFAVATVTLNTTP